MDFVLNKLLNRIVLIGVLFSLVLVSMLGEKVAFHDGLGWDGQWYYGICQDFFEKIGHHSYDTYRLQRILPFATINGLFTLFGITPSVANCIAWMNVINFTMLSLSVVVFFKIADFLKLSLPLELFGFSAFFLNYPTLKLMGYYPLLTDTAAFTFAISFVYFFIRAQKIPLLLIIASAFTWPTLLLTGLVLNYLPRDSILNDEPLSKFDSWCLKTIKCVVLFFVPAFIFMMYIYHLMKGDMLSWLNRFHHHELSPLVGSLMLLISLGSVVFYFYYLLRDINLAPIVQLKRFFRLLNARDLMWACGAYLAVNVLISCLSDGTALVSLQEMILARLIFPPLADPFVFVVTGFMYYGPCILFLLLYWRGTLGVVNQFGFSYFFLVLLGIIMFINTESRHFISFLPLFMIPLLKYMNSLDVNLFNYPKSIGIGLVSILVSRCWYPINVDGIEQAFTENVLTMFPAQRYFMSHGPWMSDEMYLIFLGVLFVCLPFVVPISGPLRVASYMRQSKPIP